MALLTRWVQIYRNEIALFLWVSITYFLVRSSNILLSNFAETTFLKRFGVEYLPLAYIANSGLTFFSVGFIGILQRRISGTRLFASVLLFCGVSIAGLRFLIPLDFSLLYGALFILKAQFEILLGLLFWSLANDIFDARQSKRIFPLITAAGLLGGVIGSFLTPTLAGIVSSDNLMVAYLCTTASGAVAVRWMAKRFPHKLFYEGGKVRPPPQESIVEQLQRVPSLVKGSRLIKVLILLHLLPNVVIPVMNFQFRYAIDQFYATEGGLLGFFGYFMGCLNTLNLFVLLFVGRLFKRWGLPVALMFHPLNYLLAFVAFLFRFDIFTAIYARLSTTVLRTTFNRPARTSLLGLLPKDQRDLIRSFLRGLVVRIGIITGSGLVLFSEGFIHPKVLSLPACFCVGAWMVATLFLKKDYLNMVLNIISGDRSDFRPLENQEAGHLFRGKALQKKLVGHFLSARGEECLWYARLLKSLQTKGLDDHILTVIKKHDDRTKVGLLSLLSPRGGEKAVRLLRDLVDPSKKDLMIAVAKAGNRFPKDTAKKLNLEILEKAEDPEAQAYAVAGLYPLEPGKYQEMIENWLNSGDSSHKKAGAIAAGRTKDPLYIQRLTALLNRESDPPLLIHTLKGLQELEAENLSRTVAPFLSYPSGPVRMAALEACKIRDDADLERIIKLLGDPSDQIHEMARSKILNASYENPHLLIASLNLPDRRIRKGLLQLLDTLHITDLNVHRFVKDQLKRSYTNLAVVHGLERLPRNRERDLLMEHLEQKGRMEMENLLRVMAAKDTTGRMRVIWRGVSSRNPRRRANGLEALDQFLDRSLSAVMIPLLDDIPVSRALAAGRKYFRLSKFEENAAELFTHLLREGDWVTVVLALFLLPPERAAGNASDATRRLKERGVDISRAAQSVIDSREQADSFLDKLFYLKEVHLFEGLTVQELATVTLQTREMDHPSGKVVLQEKEPGESMYLIMEGEVSVSKAVLEGKEWKEIEIDRMGRGACFGEMALIESDKRSATVKALKDSRFLVLHKQDFMAMAKEFPEISLHMAEVLSRRLRRLQQKLEG